MPIGTYTPPLAKSLHNFFSSNFSNFFFHFRCILLQISHKKCFFISISILGRSGVNNSAHNWICFKCQTPNFSNSSISITGSPEINFNSQNSFAVLSDLTGKDDVFLKSPLDTLFNPPLPLVTLPHFQILDIH